ncbi:MAG: hypothetical protein H6602_02550 [Flavobacteriales bacterium]|nr:hypothetical protein [Flavobacteriales bacterium]MCB9190532.1 hypothetical protein [Flavobacteriales bacterium]
MDFKLFAFRPTLVFSLLMLASTAVNAQIVDAIIGQKRSRVQALLRDYRLVDYKLEREVHTIENGIHQTVLFENDSCRKFYWAVTPTSMDRFKSLLIDNGYTSAENAGYAKDSLVLEVRALESGKATLFIASIAEGLKGERDAAGREVVKKPKPMDGTGQVQELPLLQQAILEEESKAKLDTTPKPKKVKDPSKHWVGTPSGRTKVLGWDQ